MAERAAVEVLDDFKSGLFRWEGGPKWADSWTYDESGGVKPGALALLKPTLQLTEYTLEFIAQIESSGLGFAARAADINNYYAIKLVTARPGPVPAIDIVRYAVIGGQEQERARK